MDWISRMLVTFLVNSIVQVAIIAGLALLCSVALRRAAAKYQYVLWVAALFLSSLLPLWSLKPAISSAVSVRGHDTLAGTGQSKPGPAPPNDTIALGLWSWLSQPHGEQLSFPPTLTAVLACFYAAFLVYRVVCWGSAWRRTRKLFDAAGTHPASGTVRSLVERHAKAFRLKRVPRVYARDGIGPLTVGVMQPILLMPTTFLETASGADFDTAVCHELAHISRMDFQMNLICELVSLGVSFHPAAWLMKARINQTRELACDDLAVEKLSTPTLYAGALVHIAQSLLADSRNVSPSLAQGLFDTGDMERRINNLLDKRSRLGKTRGRVLTLTMVGGLVGVTIGASTFSVEMTSDRRPAASSSEQSAKANAPSHHPHAPQDSPPRCVVPSAAKPRSSARPQSSHDRPSAKSRLRVVLASPTSSSLRSRHSRSTGSFLILLVVLRRARISGIRRVRISGTHNTRYCAPQRSD
jgi:beta-lactamase regulating signal transducer with metallopeptidase domain